jgi:hypothetical protein
LINIRVRKIALLVALPLLAIIGIIQFVPWRGMDTVKILPTGGPDNSVWPVVPFNTDLAAPTILSIVPLDNSLHVNFTPSNSPGVVYHVASAWIDGTQQQSKITGAHSTAIQLNGLTTGHTYTVLVQAMDSSGALSAPATSSATTQEQYPMPNSVFFDNFDVPAGPLNSDLYDVRISEGADQRPTDLDLAEKFQAFVNEGHFHTQMIGSVERGELYIRPRVPFDFTNRTGTFQTEVDDAPVQHGGAGKWWEVHLVSSLPWSAEELGAGRGDDLRNSIEFSLRESGDIGPVVNVPVITVNRNGNMTEFTGNATVASPTNIRMPLVLHVSHNQAVMEINGVPVVTATNINLPFDTGYWLLAHRTWYSGRDVTTQPQALQLVHWDTIQYDGPDGSTPNNVKAYLEPGCPGEIVNVGFTIRGCDAFQFGSTRNTYSVAYQLRESASDARFAQVVFNGYSDNRKLDISINGHVTHDVPVKDCRGPEGYCGGEVINTFVFPVSWLRQLNLVSFTGAARNDAQVLAPELEITYNTPRPVPAQMGDMPMPMIAATSMNMRVDRLNSDARFITATTDIYSLGSSFPLNYTAHVIAGSRFLSVSPEAGELDSPLYNGGVRHLTLTFDGDVRTDDDCEVGVIRVDGGVMPVYIAAMWCNSGARTRPVFMPTPPLNTNFNRDAIPGYQQP